MSPFPVIDVTRFYLPGFGQVADGKISNRGFGLYPSFDFTGKRDSSDLTGTRSVDWAFEFGLGARYRYDWIQGSVELCQGFNGHNRQVAEFGLDFITNPSDRIEFVFGPRATWGSEDYMQTYFGVTAAEAASPGSVLAPYSADAGFKTVGIEARANYAFNEKTVLHIKGGWNRFIGEAANSPIVKTGSNNEFTVGMGISYRFAFDLFE
jgi:outer membrane protein